MVAPLFPDLQAIKAGSIVEDQNYDFKRSIDLSDQKTKSDLIDDVVAFLNTCPGYLIIGVDEKKGRCEKLLPLKEDRDQYQRQLLSILHDNIVPKPLGICIKFVEVDGQAYLPVIEIPEHLRRPYQNKKSGAFYARTGAKNTPLTRSELQTLYVSEEKMEADVLELLERENRAVEKREIVKQTGSTLHIAIVPQEHYERGRTPFDPGQIMVKSFTHYHGQNGVFKGCDDGLEVCDTTLWEDQSNSRFFVSDDWLVHAYVAFPISVTRGEGRLTLTEFRESFSTYLTAIQQFFCSEGLRGPFMVAVEVRNLRRNSDLQWAFPNATKAKLPRPMRIERVDDPDLIDRLCVKLKTISVHGR